MKKSTLMVISCLLFLGIGNVKATSADGYEIKATVLNEGTVSSSVVMKAYKNGENLKSTDNIQYFLDIITDEEVKETEEWLIEEGKTLSDIFNETFPIEQLDDSLIANEDGNFFVSKDWYLSKDYNMAALGSCNLSTKICQYLAYEKVVKPELPALGKRYQIYLFGANEHDKINELTPFALYPVNSEAGNNMLKIKVGIIKNNDIIQKFSNNDPDALNGLLTYAKNDSDGQSWEIEESKSLQLNDFKVSNGSYYYIYTEPTRDSSTYRNLEDVTIVMAKDDMLVSNVEFKKMEEKNPENPKTGLNNYDLIGGFVLITSGIIYILVRNKKKFVK